MENDSCGKQGCPICESGKARLKQCIKTTQGYIIRCTKCRDGNIISLYHGETSCTLHSRLIEHTRGQNNKQDDNLLCKHDETIHHGVKQKCSFEPQRFFLEPLTRQVHEGFRINRTLKDTTCGPMNLRSEF